MAANVDLPEGFILQEELPEGFSIQTETPARDLTESALRKLALTGKAAYKGLTAIPALAGEAAALPYNIPARAFGWPEMRPAKALGAVGEQLYPVQPENIGERLSEDVISATGSGAGMLKTGQALSGLQGTTGQIGTYFATQPALQLAGAGTSGLASGLTREAGGSESAQMLAGLSGGLAPSVGLKAYDLTRMVASPAYKSLAVLGKQGKQVEAEDILRRLAGNEPQQVKTALAERSTYIQGKPPTTAEALAQSKLKTGETIGTGLVKLQETLKKLPEGSSKLQTIDTQRLKAHGNIIDKIAGTPAKMGALVKARSAATEKLYKAADEAVMPYTDEVKDLMARVPSDALAEAKKIAQLEGKRLSIIPSSSATGVTTLDDIGIAQNAKQVRGESLIYMLKGLKELAYNPNTPSGVAKAARDAADDFAKYLEKTNPAYKTANKRYADFSRPINRIEIGRILKDKLQTAYLPDSPVKFLTAADDAAKTIKTATGMTRLKSFEEIMSKSEINAIKAVSKDMERMLEAGRIAQKSTLPSAGTLGEQAQINLPSLLSKPVTASRWVLSMIGKDVSPEINKILADTLSDPQKLSVILKNTPKDKIPMLMQYANQFGVGAAAGTMPLVQGQQP